MSLRLRFAPLGVWPGTATPPGRREEPRFRANYTDTLEKLTYELERLNAREVVISLTVTEREIRNDGWPRADARPSAPGVLVSFTCRHGNLRYRCDQYRDWKANLRAIALTLEAQRDISRWGATTDGQQYAGWKALPQGENTEDASQQPVRASTEEAALTLSRTAAGTWSGRMILDNADSYAAALRQARARAHPDRNEGRREQWDLLCEATTVLDRHHGKVDEK